MNIKSRSLLLGVFTAFLLSILLNFAPVSVSAVEPPVISDILAQLPQGQTQENQEQWHNPQYQMLLITPNDTEFITVAEEFAEWKTFRGIPALVVSNFSAYEGIDTQERIRTAIQTYYALYPVQWVLLLGDTQLIPIRYVLNEDTPLVSDTYESLGDGKLKPTDYYYAELTANWNIDGDAYWGESAQFNNASDLPEMDWNPEVYVGRFPADTAAELQGMVDKTILYEQGGNAGDWMNRYLGISGISDPVSEDGDPDGEDEAILGQYIIDNHINESMDWLHMLEHTSAYTPLDDVRVMDLSRSVVNTSLTEGVSIMTYAGHGHPNYFAASSAVTRADVAILANENMPTFVFADSCSTNSYDYDSLGEDFIKQPTTGAIGYVGAMRVSWYYPDDTNLEMDNRGFTKAFFGEMFGNGYYQQGKALYEAKKTYVNSSWFQYTDSAEDFPYFEMERKTIFTYMLLGDPSVDIYTDVPRNFSALETVRTLIYEGNELYITAKSSEGDAIPYATIRFSAEGGLSHAVTANASGQVSIRVPLRISQLNYTVFGHNMYYFEGSMEILSDTIDPTIILPLLLTPESPTVKDMLHIQLECLDAQSGIGDVFFILSQDAFHTFTIYTFQPVDGVNQTMGNSSLLCEVILPALDYGDYMYGVIVFDQARNYQTIYLDGNPALMTIPTPVLVYLLTIGNFLILGAVVVGGSLLVYRHGKHKKPKNDIYYI
jgi:hypothetical protein